VNILAGLLAGAAIGLVHFAGLQQTIRLLTSRRRPGSWIVLSCVARFAAAIVAFGILAHFGVVALSGAVCGFWLIRTIMINGQCSQRHAHA
jgi:F1F0 ATPase subunit 2